MQGTYVLDLNINATQYILFSLRYIQLKITFSKIAVVLVQATGEDEAVPFSKSKCGA